MQYIELKSSLKTNVNNGYALIGMDEFLLNKSCELIFNALSLQMPTLNYVKFIGESIDFLEVVKFLNTMPVFDDKKLAVVNLNVKTSVLNVLSLLEYLKNPNKQAILVLVLGENDKEFKNIIPQLMVVDCNRLPEKFIDNFILSELNKYQIQIEYNALKTLKDYCVCDLTKITTELSKLVSFVSDKKLVSYLDVELLVNKTVEFQIYELTENMAKKNKEKVFEILNSLRAKKETFKTLLPLIYNHFRRLFHVAISKSNKSELSALLGVKEYAITVAFNQSKLFSKRSLKQIVDVCDNLDYELKQGIISADYAIDYLVLKVLNM